MRTRLGLALAAGMAGGLLLAGASAFDWVVEVTVRDVGGIQLEEVETTPGIDVAPGLVPTGLVATVVTLVAAVLPGRGRRAAGWALVGVGAAGAVAGVLGLVEALGLPGTVTAAPAAAFLGAGGAAVGGAILAVGRFPARHVLDDGRYTVEGPQGIGDGEWDLASAEDDGDG